MSTERYDPRSINAVLSRIETKQDQILENQEEHATSIRRLWKAHDSLKMKVVAISTGIAVLAWVVERLLGK